MADAARLHGTPHTMSYRDELAQAHARIQQLEAEAREAVLPRKSSQHGRMVALGASCGVLVLVLAAAFVSLRSAPPPENLSIAALMRATAHYNGVAIRTRGVLVANSYLRHEYSSDRSGPCKHTFEIVDQDARMAIETHDCALPDSFVDRDNIRVEVVVEGKLDERNVLVVSAHKLAAARAGWNPDPPAR